MRNAYLFSHRDGLWAGHVIYMSLHPARKCGCQIGRKVRKWRKTTSKEPGNSFFWSNTLGTL